MVKNILQTKLPDWSKTNNWLFIIILIIITNSQSIAQSDVKIHHKSLENIPTDTLPNDSSALELKDQELYFLAGGDTIQAFTKHVQWKAYHIYRSNTRKWGVDFEPYVEYSKDHTWFQKHYLFQYFYGLNQSSEGALKIAVRHMLDAENDIATHYPEFLENLYYEISNNFISLTDYQGASEYALKNLELNLNRGDKSGELSSRLLMATCFAKQNRFEETHRQRDQAIELARETGEFGQLIFIYANNAIDQRKQKNYQKSFAYYNDALATVDTNSTFNDGNLRYFRAIIHANKLTLWNDVGQTDSTLLNGPDYIDSLKVYEATESVADAQIQMGRAHLLQGNPEKAKLYLERASQFLKDSGLSELIIAANSYLADAYKALGEYQKSIDAFAIQIRVRNEMDSVNNEQLINSLQMRYESDRQQAIISKTEKQVQEEIIQRKSNMKVFTASMVGLSLLVFSAFQWKHRNQLKREKEIEVNYNQKLIQFQEDENERISKELHDGIGQSLIMIKNKVQLNHDGETAKMVGDTLDEIRSISRALHPFTLQKLGLTAALTKLVSDFDDQTDILVDTDIDLVDVHFSDKSALNIFRITQEVLSNILKHSQAKAVEFVFKKHKKYAKLTVKDNGCGFDVTENFSTVSSLGLKTLKERTRLLGGQLNIHSEKGKGTEIDLKIPYDG